jgi:hypothetical protein
MLLGVRVSVKEDKGGAGRLSDEGVALCCVIRLNW